jgi:hypothetical protein
MAHDDEKYNLMRSEMTIMRFRVFVAVSIKITVFCEVARM